MSQLKIWFLKVLFWSVFVETDYSYWNLNWIYILCGFTSKYLVRTQIIKTFSWNALIELINIKYINSAKVALYSWIDCSRLWQRPLAKGVNPFLLTVWRLYKGWGPSPEYILLWFCMLSLRERRCWHLNCFL